MPTFFQCHFSSKLLLKKTSVEKFPRLPSRPPRIESEALSTYRQRSQTLYAPVLPKLILYVNSGLYTRNSAFSDHCAPRSGRRMAMLVSDWVRRQPLGIFPATCAALSRLETVYAFISAVIWLSDSSTFSMAYSASRLTFPSASTKAPFPQPTGIFFGSAAVEVRGREPVPGLNSVLYS
ncbi:hypothetical protein D3C75_845800 [compost metagenome]